MSRRRVVALASAGVLLTLGLLIAAAVVSLTQTSFGRERIRRLLVERIAAAMSGRGTLYIGRIGGGLLSGVTVDSLALRDADDSLVVSTGPVRIQYDLRDLLDRRLLIRSLDVDRPVVNLRRHGDGVWNYRRIFPQGPERSVGPSRRFGDYVVIERALVHDGTLLVTMPWSPPDWLRGAQRDSAARAALRDSNRTVRRTAEGLKRTWRWTELDADLPLVQLADPGHRGRTISVARLDVVERDPPFRFRDVTGLVSIRNDTVTLDVRRFRLPGSTGSARGRVMYGGPGPVRYDIAVRADSVSLRDVNWVYPTLPLEGGGSTRLTIRSRPRAPGMVDYRLTQLDMRAARSHLTGAMTFGVGGPVLEVRDVNLRADPVDFALLRALNGAPLPVDWRGTITGTVRGPGGPLTRFGVSDARFTFRDANVPGAITRGSARGGLDILEPSRTVFRGLDVALETLDLRTITYLFPDFPRLGGTLSGRATLDSSWLDVRLRNADITHRDGTAEPTRATGGARVTYDSERMRFDAALELAPLSFGTLARSYPALPLRGTLAGPLRVQGTMADLGVAGTLTGAAGTVSVDGRFDLIAPELSARATAAAAGLDLRALLARPALPSTRLTGTLTADVSGDSLSDLAGTLDVALERSRVDTLRIQPSLARLAFSSGRLRVDSLRLETSAATLTAQGALGLVPGAVDTLRYAIAVDSLGGLRPWLPGAGNAWSAVAATDSSVRASPRDSARRASRDSLAGVVEARGTLAGTVGALAVRGTLAGRDLFYRGEQARGLAAEYSFGGLPRAPQGTASLRLDTLEVAGIRFRTAAAQLALPASTEGRLALQATSENDIRATLGAGFERAAGVLRVVTDTLQLRIGEHGWALAAPARARFDTAGTALDSLVLRHDEGGRLALAGELPREGAVEVRVAADSLPLSDVGAIAQSRVALGGTLDLRLGITGTRAAPRVQLATSVSDARRGTLRFPYFTLSGDYAAQRLRLGFTMYRDSAPVLTATGVLPLDLSLVPVAQRRLDAPLSGELRADSVDLAILEAITPALQRVDGSFTTRVQVGGTWRAPSLRGRLTVAEGAATIPELGVRLERLTADVGFAPDTILVRQLSMASGEQRGDTVALEGLVRFGVRGGPVFDLTLAANNFQAVRTRRIADASVSGQLRLTGPYRAAHLSGGLTVQRGTLYLPERQQKQLVDLSDPEFSDVVDTTQLANRAILPEAPNPYLDTLVRNLSVDQVALRAGENVWLRSSEANIQLGGGVEVTRPQSSDALALTGTLQAARGTYRLDLGLVQRTFQVDSGRVQFFGEPELNPGLDIATSYVVRQANRDDVRIRALITGTLLSPRLVLTSDERVPLSETEILSYLVFGAPSFALGQQNESALRPVAAALLPTLGGVVERALADQLGFIDVFQISAGSASDQNPLTGTGAASVLSGSRIGIGKQLTERTFVTANAGLCSLTGTGDNPDQSFTQSLGLTVQQRLNAGWSVQLGIEPPAAALRCGRSGVLNTPRQFGVDLFREWSF